MKIRVYDKKYKIWDTEPVLFYPGEEIKKRGRVIQFSTGMTDLNNKEIYEGDIIQLEGSSYKYEVVWNKWQWGIDSKGVVTDFIQGFTSAVENRAIVIGNIFENSELLK